MSEQAESYKYTSTPDRSGWEPAFSNGWSQFYYETGRRPKEAFISCEENLKLRDFIFNMPMYKDLCPRPLPEGSIGIYRDVALYTASKPGITFA
jgi:hypothetical protein